jgi:hypothetical protein
MRSSLDPGISDTGCNGRDATARLSNRIASDFGNRIEKKPNFATARLTWTEARSPSKNIIDHITRHSDEFPGGPESSGVGHPPE